MRNTDWKDETVQELKKGYMAMITDRDERIARLTAGSEAMQEDARKNTATINSMKEQIQETLDLLRTGCAPDAFNMDEKQWMIHKINRAASFLSAILRGQK